MVMKGDENMKIILKMSDGFVYEGDLIEPEKGDVDISAKNVLKGDEDTRQSMRYKGAISFSLRQIVWSYMIDK